MADEGIVFSPGDAKRIAAVVRAAEDAGPPRDERRAGRGPAVPAVLFVLCNSDTPGPVIGGYDGQWLDYDASTDTWTDGGYCILRSSNGANLQRNVRYPARLVGTATVNDFPVYETIDMEVVLRVTSGPNLGGLYDAIAEYWDVGTETWIPTRAVLVVNANP